MQIGFVGLGKMGMNMVTRLIRGGHSVVAFDTDGQKRAAVKELVAAMPATGSRSSEGTGATPKSSIVSMVAELVVPRVVWIMVPSGPITEEVIEQLAAVLQPGDILIDGGNSNFRDTRRRAATLVESGRGVYLLDAGTSGGVWGLERGYCLMVGGDAAAAGHVEPLMRTLAPEGGYLYCGPAGSGHYAKMIHNAIEYGMMEAYGEGFAMLEAADKTLGYHYDLAAVADLWQHGSVISSWLLELLTRAFRQDGDLSKIAGWVEDSGEGRWTVKESIDAAVPTPVLTLALQMRFVSRLKDMFSAKVNAALRNQFGGHAVKSGGPATDHKEDKP